MSAAAAFFAVCKRFSCMEHSKVVDILDVSCAKWPFECNLYSNALQEIESLTLHWTDHFQRIVASNPRSTQEMTARVVQDGLSSLFKEKGT